MRHGSPIRERGLDGRIKFRITEVNQLKTGSGLSIAVLFSGPFLHETVSVSRPSSSAESEIVADSSLSTVTLSIDEKRGRERHMVIS
jgi:hypothetical protein